jgi:hypothetical protein
MSLTMTISALLIVLASFALNRDAYQEKSPGTTNDIHYSMSPVSDTQIRFPRLTAYKDITTMNRVNAQIDELSKEFGCPAPHGKDDWYKVISRVEYAAKDILSIYASANYYCGGPYPTNDANMSLTFDLRTGKKVQFAELFKSYDVNKDQILKIIFARQLARTEKLLAAGRKSDESSNCEENSDLFTLEILRDSEYAYNFSEKGLVVQPQWPHVVEACAERVTVPYQQLMEFAAPNGILARIP